MWKICKNTNNKAVCTVQSKAYALISIRKVKLFAMVRRDIV